jgi:hypothetical protein
MFTRARLIQAGLVAAASPPVPWLRHPRCLVSLATTLPDTNWPATTPALAASPIDNDAFATCHRRPTGPGPITSRWGHPRWRPRPPGEGVSRGVPERRPRRSRRCARLVP